MKPTEKSMFGYYFLGFVLILYLFFSIYNFEIIVVSLNYFFSLMKNVLPLLLFIYILMVISDFYLTEEKIKKLSSKFNGFRGWILAIISGIISSGPIYMWYPFLSNLKNKGVRTGFLVAFLYNRAIKIPLIPVMLIVFNVNYILVLFVVMVLASIVQGKIVEVILEK
ncbi:MAG: hypothetical protein PF569_08875 [Candidatus Woesearchaeota archaeon]|jgi:uncharacterized membrane protein YraQ (UPF0718 family)|nr:hypothetical protein [Candidatus Woesearchaeota archaeon]